MKFPFSRKFILPDIPICFHIVCRVKCIRQPVICSVNCKYQTKEQTQFQVIFFHTHTLVIYPLKIYRPYIQVHWAAHNTKETHNRIMLSSFATINMFSRGQKSKHMKISRNLTNHLCIILPLSTSKKRRVVHQPERIWQRSSPCLFIRCSFRYCGTPWKLSDCTKFRYLENLSIVFVCVWKLSLLGHIEFFHLLTCFVSMHETIFFSLLHMRFDKSTLFFRVRKQSFLSLFHIVFYFVLYQCQNRKMQRHFGYVKKFLQQG